MSLRTAFISVSVALGAVLAAAAPAHAAPPERDFFTDQQTRTVTSLCPFKVGLVATFPDTRQVDFRDRNGVLRRTTYHIVEQDTFTANGKTLVGTPYRFRTVINFDKAGEIISAYGTGHHVRVLLPDGSTFVVAGRVDFLAQVNDFVFTPTSGSSKNVAGFCAALAP